MNNELYKLEDVPVVILCGGQGTRIREISETVPKPMNIIGNKPILWHIMKIFSYYGIHNSLLCLGYKGNIIKEYFLNYRAMVSDFTVSLGCDDKVEYFGTNDEAQWRVTLADTGEHTMTGGRLARVRKYLSDCEHFFLTYGDGLANIDLKALLKEHLSSGLVGTITAVKVTGRFGELEIKDGKVTNFSEKPAITDSRVNGGFMVFDAKRVWDYVEPKDDCNLERDMLFKMSADNQLGIYKHDGFWQCMDTPREYDLLNKMWTAGNAPWKLWD